jgi:hypothetical protein
MLPGRMKQQVADDLKPEPHLPVLGSVTEQERHLLAVLVAEVTWIEMKEPAIDAL